jgi:hypothetical protein
MLAQFTNFLIGLKDQKGFKLGEPFQKNKEDLHCVVPIIRDRFEEPDYVQLERIVPRLQEVGWKNTGIPLFEKQVGVFMIDANGIKVMELFDHPDTWKAMHDKMLANYQKLFLNKQSAVQVIFARDTTESLIKDFIRDLILSRTSSKNENTLTFLATRSIGEFTVLNNRVIHLYAIRKEDRRNVKNSNPIQA